MVNKVFKNHPEDMTRDELIDKLGWAESSFKDRMKRFIQSYKFVEDPFTDKETKKMLFDRRLKDIVYVLLAAFPQHPREKDKSGGANITMEKILLYYKNLTGFIDTLEDDARYKIQGDPMYLKLVSQVHAIEQVITKFNRLLSATLLVDRGLRLSVWEELYNHMDGLFYATFDRAIQKESELKRVKPNESVIGRKIKRIGNLKNDKQRFRNESVKLIEEEIQAHSAKEFPFDTLDGYLVFKLKAIILAIEAEKLSDKDIYDKQRIINAKDTDADLLIAAEHVKQNLRIAHPIVQTFIDEKIEKLDLEAEKQMKQQDQEWKKQIDESAERAKKPFSHITLIEDELKGLWEQRHQVPQEHLEKLHVERFIEFSKLVDKETIDLSHIPNRILRELVTDLCKPPKKNKSKLTIDI